jgi:hypothetical protein
VHPTVGHEHALDRVHVGDDGVEGERLVRGETGVHRLEAEDLLQSLVGEERRDLLVELAEAAEADELEPGLPRLDEVGDRVEVHVDEVVHLDAVEALEPVAEAPERGGLGAVGERRISSVIASRP